MPRLYIGLIVLTYLIGAAFFLKQGHQAITAWMILMLYTMVGCALLLMWSVNATIGILVLCFVIFLAGILLGHKRIIPVTLFVVLALFIIETLHLLGIIVPDRQSLIHDPSIGDAAGYAILFGIFALVAWIAGNMSERALISAQKAEIALEKERDLLAIRLEKRTKSLKEAQLEEMKQLYHFAELGQLTTVILHDLANNLNILSLDIDDLQKHKHSDAISRAKSSIEYLDSLVLETRKQIQTANTRIRFNVLKVVSEATRSLQQKAIKTNVLLSIERNSLRSFYTTGDPLRLSQCISILLNNAIEACHDTGSSKRPNVVLSTSISDDQLIISVIDDGIGISKDKRKELFSPLKSTKGSGLGIGLFMAKQIITSHFHGDILLDPRTDRTEFKITLPQIKN